MQRLTAADDGKHWSAMANELTTETRRTGNLIDFDPDTPHVHVTLERSTDGISVTVPWSGEDSPYPAWFGTDGSWRRTKSEGRAPRSVPKRLLFQDSHGSVMLIGCWARGFHSTIDGPGSGTVWSRAAILGVDADVDFDRPHGLQTEISGLRDWLKVTSWSEETDWEENGLVARIHSLRAPMIEIGTFNGISFEFRQSWQIVPDDGRDRIVLLDLVRACSRGTEPVLWEEHLELHRAVRDLLVLSRWRNESCVAVRAHREDDPLRTLDGKERGGQWRDVIVPDDDREPPPIGYRSHLIEYQDLGPAGIARWIDLRNEFARALDPVITGIDLDATANTLLAHTGPGIEALGYLLMLRDGAAPRRAARAILRERLERVLADIDETVPFDGATWVSKTVETYNGLKHANRQAPYEVDVANAWRECVLAVRAWVALELGVPAEQVTARLKNDPHRHPYRRRT
ncbi:HEPN domain-containing protein [Nocardioides vastitatis]|uniref:HEPN domain-containing protein n=2 Tax=Nocardioides vastitatis TaxID=2568655 RepID=A0ABW0ZKA0_9ACTN|nr:HEPN domain-containing protein [Nocardioides sp.]